MSKPFFSVIVCYYRDSVSDERFIKCLESLASQSCKDFELLLFHDGQLSKPLCKEAEKLIVDNGYRLLLTDKRFNDWGHSLRDFGLRSANGQYAVILNADNLLYDSLGEIKSFIESTGKKPFYTFGVRMVGVKEVYRNSRYKRVTRTGNPQDSVLLSGFPKPSSIDALQGVASLTAWKSIGYWHRKDRDSDGYLYEELADLYAAINNNKILIGEHW